MPFVVQCDTRLLNVANDQHVDGSDAKQHSDGNQVDAVQFSECRGEISQVGVPVDLVEYVPVRLFPFVELVSHGVSRELARDAPRANARQIMRPIEIHCNRNIVRIG